MKYIVYDNNRPAMYPYIKVHKSWDNCIFETLSQAQHYALKWLGLNSDDDTPEELEEWFNTSMPPGKKYDYSGYGDTLEIREIDNNTAIKIAANLL